MDHVKFSVEVQTPLEKVLNDFWRLEDWPSLAPHVKKIEMLYENDSVQVLLMHVATGNRSDRFMSVRVLQGSNIFYFQPQPPPAMHQHFGWWRLSEAGGVTTVESDHSLDVDLENAALFLRSAGLAAEGEDEVRARFCQVIHDNSRQTMLALKQRLEEKASKEGGSHAA